MVSGIGHWVGLCSQKSLERSDKGIRAFNLKQRLPNASVQLLRFSRICKTAKTAETASGLFDIHHLSSALPEDKPKIVLRFPKVCYTFAERER